MNHSPTPRQIASKRVRQRAVCEEFHNHGRRPEQSSWISQLADCLRCAPFAPGSVSLAAQAPTTPAWSVAPPCAPILF